MNTLKIATILCISFLWIQFLNLFLPEDVVYGGYLIVAIYLRLLYVRNSQIEHILYRSVPVLVPEVIPHH